MTSFPANKLVRLGLRLSNISCDELTTGLSYHCPLNYQPLLPKDRRMIINGPQRPYGSTGPRRNALAASGSLCAPLVSR